MVLELSIQKIIDGPGVIPLNTKCQKDLFKISIDGIRMLTVVTDHDSTVAGKWFSDVLRAKTTNSTPPLAGAATTFPRDAIFVGVVAQERSRFNMAKPNGDGDSPFDLLALCTGSDGLIVELCPTGEKTEAAKQVKAFFADRRIVVFATGMKKLIKRLHEKHGIVLANAVDLNDFAVKAMKRDDLDLGKYDEEKLILTVLGKEFDVVKPAEVKWAPTEPWYDDLGNYFYSSYSGDRLSAEMVLFTAVASYLRLKMGLKLQAMEGEASSSSKSGKKNKEN